MTKLITLFLLAVGALAQTVSPTGPLNAKPTYLPTWVVSAGVGALTHGSGKLGYDSVSYNVGQATYVTAVNEYTVVKGVLETCPLAGLTKALYQFRGVTVGTTGLGGACNAAPAGTAQGFVHMRWKQSHWGVALTATKPFTSGVSNAVKVSLGFVWMGD
jgi:hypothetical protein